MMTADQKLHFDLLVHAGDIRYEQSIGLPIGSGGMRLMCEHGCFSYANGVQEIWDAWGRMTQPLASHLPWMVAVGNHELIDLLVPYLERFSMPGMPSSWLVDVMNGSVSNGQISAKQSGGTWGNLYYSWDYGNIHFIALDSESFEYFEMSPQYIWLKADLEKVDRKKTPWVVAFWHTPWYCSNTGMPFCLPRCVLVRIILNDQQCTRELVG